MWLIEVRILEPPGDDRRLYLSCATVVYILGNCGPRNVTRFHAAPVVQLAWAMKMEIEESRMDACLPIGLGNLETGPLSIVPQPAEGLPTRMHGLNTLIDNIGTCAMHSSEMQEAEYREEWRSGFTTALDANPGGSIVSKHSLRTSSGMSAPGPGDRLHDQRSRASKTYWRMDPEQEVATVMCLADDIEAALAAWTTAADEDERMLRNMHETVDCIPNVLHRAGCPGSLEGQSPRMATAGPAAPLHQQWVDHKLTGAQSSMYSEAHKSELQAGLEPGENADGGQLQQVLPHVWYRNQHQELALHYRLVRKRILFCAAADLRAQAALLGT